MSFAARSGHKKIAELLIDKGADLKGTHAITPMHIAAEEGHKEVVELLIAKGADVNAMFVARVLVNHDWQGMTPIDTANEGNQSETADLIRKHGGKTSEELKAEGK